MSAWELVAAGVLLCASMYLGTGWSLALFTLPNRPQMISTGSCERSSSASGSSRSSTGAVSSISGAVNRVFLTIMAPTWPRGLLSLVVDGTRSAAMISFLVWELVGGVVIFVNTRSTAVA